MKMKESVGRVTTLMLVSSVVSLLSILLDEAYGSPDFDFNVASKSAARLETQIELSISLKNLTGPGFSNNALCVTFIKPKDGEKWTEYHQTETQLGTRNPIFTSKVRLPYLLKNNGAKIKFEIHHLFDHINEPSVFEGLVIRELAELSGTTQWKLMAGEKEFSSSIVVHAEKFDSEDQVTTVSFKVRGEDLKEKRFLRTPKYCLEIYKRVSQNEKGESTNNKDDYIIAYRTEVKYLYNEADWKEIILPFNTFCNGEWNRELKFVCRDANKSVGEFLSTAKEISTGTAVTKFTLQDKKKNPAGKITISKFGVVSVPSFSNLMAGGLELEVTIAIDFSVVNNGPAEKSFHYRGEGENRYEKAIRLVVGAFKDYVWNNQYDIRVFGGAQKEDGTNLVDFQLGRAEGVDHALDMYRDAFTKIQMGTKANLRPMISRLSETVENYKSSSVNKYHVLVVLMAGEIANDLGSERALYNVYPVPLSIVFVGIDDTNFTEVKKVDAKTSKEQYPRSREILHFMSLHDYDPLDDGSKSYREVELLAKLPEQVVSYARYSQNVKPYVDSTHL